MKTKKQREDMRADIARGKVDDPIKELVYALSILDAKDVRMGILEEAVSCCDCCGRRTYQYESVPGRGNGPCRLCNADGKADKHEPQEIKSIRRLTQEFIARLEKEIEDGKLEEKSLRAQVAVLQAQHAQQKKTIIGLSETLDAERGPYGRPEIPR